MAFLHHHHTPAGHPDTAPSTEPLDPDAAERAMVAASDEFGQSDPFNQLVADALDELPEQFLHALDHVPVVVSDEGAHVGAYGLYHGAGVARPDVPAQIFIYRDTLTRDFGRHPAQLAEQVRRVVRHELGHHLGFDEDGVHHLGL